MAFEMICGQCRGNLLVEQFGVVVACPHCGAHLSIPDPTPPAPAASIPPPSVAPPAAPPPPPISAPAPVITPPAPPAGPISALQPFSAAGVSVPASPPAAAPELVAILPVVEEQLPFFGLPTTIEMPEVVRATEVVAPEPIPAASANPLDSFFGAVEDTVPTLVAPAAPESMTSEPRAPVAPEITQTVIDTEAPVANLSASGLGLHDLFGGATQTAPAEKTPDDSPSGVIRQPSSSAGNSAKSASGTESDTATVTKVSKPSDKDKDHVLVSKTALMLLLSYTSAISLGFAWLFFQSLKSKDSDYGLESLPDIAPLKKNVSLRLVPEREEMPDGHELEIGDSQRFGNIKVTVLKVTRGPIQFAHFSGKPNKTRLPTAPVLKLWLKFQNVSKDQEIAPLDARLLFAKAGKDRCARSAT